MTRALRIAGGELRLMVRSRLALIGLIALAALSVIAAVTSAAQTERTRAARAADQHAADDQFRAQPARHPHRMVHYGSYALRPVGPLAAFDPGVDPFTGTVLYLEGHRQNAAAFGAAREGSDLIRFGQLTPAFVLQTLAPLLLIVLGFASVARERESGGLLALRAHGASTGAIIGGKALALAAAAGVAALPAMIALGAVAAKTPGEGAVALAVAAAYALYLLGWAFAVVAGSALARTAQLALVALIALWAVLVILTPRAAAAWAAVAEPLPSRAETELRIGADLRRLGDSHNPNDPFFAAFKARLLTRYGVARVEDLPINYRGAVSAEGEALTARLFRAYADRQAIAQRAQVAALDALGWLSPAVAVRRVSMAGAATDLSTHLAFLDQAEAHRYAMVQRLNAMHTTLVTAADDAARGKDAAADRRTRIGAANWSSIPPFQFSARPPGERLATATPALAQLALWVALTSAALALSARRLGRA